MENKEKGYFALVLHAHLPFIRHPEHDDFLEEDWYFEAMCETYIPLLDIYERLSGENTDFRVTMSLTPPLCNMMSDELLRERFRRYYNQRLSWRKGSGPQPQHPFHEVAKCTSANSGAYANSTKIITTAIS